MTRVIVNLLDGPPIQVVGRPIPTENRMRIFAPKEVGAKSRFWNFLRYVRYAINWQERVSKEPARQLVINMLERCDPLTFAVKNLPHSS